MHLIWRQERVEITSPSQTTWIHVKLKSLLQKVWNRLVHIKIEASTSRGFGICARASLARIVRDRGNRSYQAFNWIEWGLKKYVNLVYSVACQLVLAKSWSRHRWLQECQNCMFWHNLFSEFPFLKIPAFLSQFPTRPEKFGPGCSWFRSSGSTTASGRRGAAAKWSATQREENNFRNWRADSGFQPGLPDLSPLDPVAWSPVCNQWTRREKRNKLGCENAIAAMVLHCPHCTHQATHTSKWDLAICVARPVWMGLNANPKLPMHMCQASNWRLLVLVSGLLIQLKVRDELTSCSVQFSGGCWVEARCELTTTAMAAGSSSDK